ncbi:HTH-type transcriptional regulator VirS [compost metagenome]
MVQTTLATIVRSIATTLRHDYGLDPLPVLASVGIDPAVMQDSELRLPMTTLNPLWLRCVEVTGDADFGLRVVRYHQSANLYGLDLALYACASLGEAVRRHVQLIKLINTSAEAHLLPGENGDWRLELHRIGPTSPTMAARDFYLLFHVRMFERLAGQPASRLFRQLEFYREGLAESSPWWQLGVPLLFNQPLAALVFKQGGWDRPLPGANPRLLAEVEQPILQHLARHDMPLPLSALRARLAGMLRTSVSLEQLAASLEIAPGQLQETLRQQQVSFAQLLDQTREAQALLLLGSSELPLERVAERIGFSSASALVKAFRRWQGTTPLNYRKERLGRE